LHGTTIPTPAVDDRANLHAIIPITEWTGSSVSLANNRVEFAYNSDDTASNNTTSFAYGPEGVLVPNIASTGTTYYKDVKFLTPIQSTDKLTLQVYYNGQWADSGSSYLGYQYDGTTHYGVLYQGSGTSNQMRIYFREGGPYPGATWQAVHNGGVKWRVVKSSNPLSVGNTHTTYWQTKTFNAGGWWTGTGNMSTKDSNFKFSNLISGKVYKIKLNAYVYLNGSPNIHITIKSGTTDLGTIQHFTNNADKIATHLELSQLFISNGSNIEFYVANNGANGIYGANDLTSTFATLEEVSDYQQTNKW
jgi:hypothetical protein